MYINMIFLIGALCCPLFHDSVVYINTLWTCKSHHLIITCRQIASHNSHTAYHIILFPQERRAHTHTHTEMGAEIDVTEIEAVMNKSITFAAENMSLKGNGTTELPLLSLNHVSFVCKSVQKSVEFYCKVLGFVLIKRPSSFNFEGAWYVHFPFPISLFPLFLFLSNHTIRLWFH